VGLGSTELVPSRLNALPALKASRSVMVVEIENAYLTCVKRDAYAKPWENCLYITRDCFRVNLGSVAHTSLCRLLALTTPQPGEHHQMHPQAIL